MSEIRFKAPDKNAPGYLLRLKKSLYFRERGQKILNGEIPDPGYVDELVDFLAEFIVEPDDPEQAKAALWQASEQQYFDMLAVVGGAADSPLASENGKT